MTVWTYTNLALTAVALTAFTRTWLMRRDTYAIVKRLTGGPR